MRQLPVADPGTPDHRSPARYLLWVASGQKATLLGGMAFGILWMGAQAFVPAILGKAIDQGIAAGDTERLLLWTTALFAVGVLQALAGIMRHRFAVVNWLSGAYRTVQVVTRKSADLGATLPKNLATGEVVSVGASDLAYIGNVLEVVARFAGAIVAFVVVAVILLSSSTLLGLVVLIGVPVMLFCLGPMLRPLHKRQSAHREAVGELNSLGSDIVAGLRVLRGIGGEDSFSTRYRRESQLVRGAGVRVARIQSVLDAAQVFLPGIFIVIVVGLGAHFALRGELSAGTLVAFYGYATFLVMPLRTATEAADKLMRGLVAARRVNRVLSLTSDIVDPATPVGLPDRGDLVDPVSGIRARDGLLTAIVSAEPDRAAVLADRLGRYDDTSEVRYGGVTLASATRADVRGRIFVSDTGAQMFTGTLREELDPDGRRSDEELMAAMRTASAEDVLVALTDGLDSTVEEKGRSFSGGQRQRLVLVRALLADPSVLVLVEPTSAVDAHTEARIADRLREHRAGRSTVVLTSSPLLLDRVDEVIFVSAGRVVAVGKHRELLQTDQLYRRTVTRQTEDEEVLA
ncbi:ABC-type multidrug transport system fused ATPase/permease subunit [Kribbella orskensis]|uniref:ABC-type multidrug transport system fused ATPase/permease subunit n=1 Tax=Kribbella orskensis TaxID=2512216 RepID=A0ABY2BI48_9ACTN|nr:MULTISPECIES: ABC transporter ATP-binding protein [Kribbella]TCN38798.1 ABC-type multidrug transport system fused ATPase/permease subunit [Kribbella sp. VKM Ac-2500]TCO20979.1 ABC-type multidrug transport system fused ATPase/permease subunit [Kribbella orskensis]